MKKVLAIILSIAMLFGVLAINTFAATDPTVSVVTNAGSPIASGTDTYFTVKFENFSTIQGMDITISADSGITLYDDITVTGFGITPKLNENYTFSSSAIHIVDLTGGASGKITFKAKAASATANVTISGEYAKSGTELFTIAAKNGAVEVVKAPTQTTINNSSLSQPADTTTFIPYGSVYKTVDNKIVFAEKGTGGTFDTTGGGYTAETFEVPAGGLGTFGASNKKGEEAVRFGNYSNKNESGVTHGTMVFEGDWLAVKNLYIKNGYSVDQIIKLFSDAYDAKKATNENLDYVYYTVSGKEFRVYKFAQKNYMWKENKVLEYAITLNKASENTNYTAIAYSIKDSTTTLSTTVKSVTYTAN